jgi:hypothetical protein
MTFTDVSKEFFPGDESYDSLSNKFHHTYYAPELRLILIRYRSLEHDKKGLDCFVQQQQTLATQLMHVRALSILLGFQSECTFRVARFYLIGTYQSNESNMRRKLTWPVQGKIGRGVSIHFYPCLTIHNYLVLKRSLSN